MGIYGNEGKIDGDGAQIAAGTAILMTLECGMRFLGDHLNGGIPILQSTGRITTSTGRGRKSGLRRKWSRILEKNARHHSQKACE